ARPSFCKDLARPRHRVRHRRKKDSRSAADDRSDWVRGSLCLRACARVRQRLGQHFLHDSNVIDAIVSAAELAKEETALEIGPGKGILTQRLLGRVKRLVAVEIDRSLAEALPRQFAGSSGVRIVAGDFLKQDLDALFSVND